MKITINKNELKKTLSVCSAAVGKINLASPIDGVLFSASTNELKLTTYDYDTAITCKVDCDIVEPGETLVSFKLLNDIVSKCEGNITIESDISNIIIRNGRAHYKLPSESVDCFPELPALPKEVETVSVPFDIFYNGVHKVERFIAVGDATTNNPLIGTTQIKIKDGEIIFVATDGFRIAKYVATINNPDEFEVYLNKKVLKICLETEVPDVVISKGTRHNVIQMNNVTVVSRAYSGEYINHDAIFNAPMKYVGKITTASFKNAVNAVYPIVENSSKTPVRLNFLEPGNLKLKMSTSLGNSEVDCELKENIVDSNDEDYNSETGMNIKYLLDALSVCTDDDIVIKQESSISPLCIKEKDATYLLMPMRIK